MKRFKIGDKVRNIITGEQGVVTELSSDDTVICVDYKMKWARNHKLVEDYTAPQQADQWDEAVRGKKMSAAKGKVIYKYQMPVLEHFTMKLPKNAEIIRMEDQGGMFWLWAIVDTEVEDEERSFYAFKCGGEIPRHLKLKYVGFCAVHVQMELGLYIFEEVL